jgi:hypothetical protein
MERGPPRKLPHPLSVAATISRQASTTLGDRVPISTPNRSTSPSDVTGRPSLVCGCELAKSWRSAAQRLGSVAEQALGRFKATLLAVAFERLRECLTPLLSQVVGRLLRSLVSGLARPACAAQSPRSTARADRRSPRLLIAVQVCLVALAMLQVQTPPKTPRLPVLEAAMRQKRLEMDRTVVQVNRSALAWSIQAT